MGVFFSSPASTASATPVSETPSAAATTISSTPSHPASDFCLVNKSDVQGKASEVKSPASSPSLSADEKSELSRPVIANMFLIYSKKAEISAWVRANQGYDTFYYFPKVGKSDDKSKPTSDENMWMAGSAALRAFLNLFPSLFANSKKINDACKSKPDDWKPNDVDWFRLGQKTQTRTLCGNADFINVRAKTPQALLAGFDLPCCRVASSASGDWLLSAHFMHALLTGEYFVPGLFNPALSDKQVTDTLRSELAAPGQRGRLSSSLIRADKVKARVLKYAERGFFPVYVPTLTLSSFFASAWTGYSSETKST